MKKTKKAKRLRLLFNSNAVWAQSGYSQQCRQFLPLIVKEGYPVGLINFYGLEGGKIEYQGITMYPRMADVWGTDAMIHHAKNFRAHTVISLQDIWTIPTETLKQVKNWIPIVPIDHEPTPPAILERLRVAYRIITYSKFGYEQLKNEGLHSTLIPHTVDTKMFYKLNKKHIRRQLNLPQDYFMFGMVAANKDNPPRKSYQEVLDAFNMFVQKHPKSGIYFHALTNQDKGFPIEQYAKYLGINNHVYKTDAYDCLYNVGPDDMKQIYSALDCYLAPSTNEGFGVPIIEAQACECPVIANNFTAMKDLVIPGETGYLCSVLYKRFSPLLSYVGIPSTQSLYQAMEKVYKTNRNKMGKAGRKFIVENYDLNLVFQRDWKPFLEKLEKELC